MNIKYKNILLLIFFGFFINNCTLRNKNHLRPPINNYVKILHRVDIISCKKPNSGKCALGLYQTSGSGMIINFSIKYPSGFILTAGHVCSTNLSKDIESSLQFNQVMDKEGQIHDAHVVMISRIEQGNPDLCLLYAPTIIQRGTKISHKKPVIGDLIYYIGSPAGVYHPPVAPILSGIYSGEISFTSAMITAPAMGGSSGSAILNQNNEIIGILWAAHPEFHHVTLMSSFDSFHKFLKESRKLINSL